MIKSFSSPALLTRLSILLIAFLLITSFSFSQKFDWAYSNGGWVTDHASQIIIDETGNSYITGKATGSVDFSPAGPQLSSWAAYVAKLDPSGNLLWIKFGEGSYNGSGTDLALDGEGNLYVTGSFSYSITFDNNIQLRAGIQPKTFLVKYTPGGQILWAKVVGSYDAGSTLPNASRSIAIDQKNNIYITGSFMPALPLDNGDVLKDLYPDYWPDRDIFLLKYDKDGTLIWGKVAATPYNDDFVTAVKVTPDNKLVLALSLGSDNFKYNNNEEQHYSFSEAVWYTGAGSAVKGSLIATLDTDGTWLKATPLSGFVTDLDINHEGSIVAVGNFYKTIRIGDVDLTSEWIDGFVTLVSSDNKNQWSKKVMIVDMRIACHEEAIYVTGATQPGATVDGLAMPTGSTNNAAVFKLNADGYGQWLKGLKGGVHTTSIYGSDSGVGITGVYTPLSLNLDDIQLTNNSGNGDEDFFAAVMADESPIRCPENSSVTLSADKNTICEGDFATLTPAPGGQRIKWYKDNQWLKTDLSVPLKTNATGEFYFTTNITAAGCEADTSTKVSIRIIEIPDPTITASPGVLSCNNERVRLSVEDNVAYSYRWLKDNSNISSETSPLLEVTSTGQYKVIISNEGMCSSESSKSIIVLPEEIDFLPDTVFHCTNASVALKPITKFAGWNYQWSTGHTTPELQASIDGIYQLTLSYEHCEAKDNIVIDTDADIFVPNVITPNNDLKNDFFVVDKPGADAVKIQIQTRWGKPIFQSDDYRNDWPQEPLTTGTYYYTIYSTGCYSAKKGWLHVQR